MKLKLTDKVRNHKRVKRFSFKPWRRLEKHPIQPDPHALAERSYGRLKTSFG